MSYNPQEVKICTCGHYMQMYVYQVATNIMRVAIVPMAYSDRKFTDEEVILLKRLVKGCMFDLVKVSKAPIFQGTSDEDSAVIFNCAMQILSSG